MNPIMGVCPKCHGVGRKSHQETSPKCKPCEGTGRVPKLDGLGQPLSPDEKYYVQDTRQIVGNCVLWWRPEGKGYTCDLNDAGTYWGNQVSSRESDLPWPVEYVKARTITHVHNEVLLRDRRMLTSDR